MAIDTKATLKEFLILQMNETCQRVQDLECALNDENTVDDIKVIESLLKEARANHTDAVNQFKDFIKNNPQKMKPVTHLRLS